MESVSKNVERKSSLISILFSFKEQKIWKTENALFRQGCYLQKMVYIISNANIWKCNLTLQLLLNFYRIICWSSIYLKVYE